MKSKALYHRVPVFICFEAIEVVVFYYEDMIFVSLFLWVGRGKLEYHSPLIFLATPGNIGPLRFFCFFQAGHQMANF